MAGVHPGGAGGAVPGVWRGNMPTAAGCVDGVEGGVCGCGAPNAPTAATLLPITGTTPTAAIVVAAHGASLSADHVMLGSACGRSGMVAGNGATQVFATPGATTVRRGGIIRPQADMVSEIAVSVPQVDINLEPLRRAVLVSVRLGTPTQVRGQRLVVGAANARISGEEARATVQTYSPATTDRAIDATRSLWRVLRASTVRRPTCAALINALRASTTEGCLALAGTASADTPTTPATMDAPIVVLVDTLAPAELAAAVPRADTTPTTQGVGATVARLVVTTLGRARLAPHGVLLAPTRDGGGPIVVPALREDTLFDPPAATVPWVGISLTPRSGGALTVPLASTNLTPGGLAATPVLLAT